MTITFLLYILRFEEAMVIFYAKDISSSINHLIVSNNIGLVHSVYKNTINLSYNGKIVSIQPDELPKTPMIISVYDKEKRFKNLNIQVGQKALFQDGKLNVGKNVFNLSKAQLWNPDISKIIICEEELVTEKIRLLYNLLYLQGSNDGLRDIGLWLYHMKSKSHDQKLSNELVNIAFPRILGIVESTLKGDISSAVANGIDLIGIGPGLTPSGDDFLIGFISVLFTIEPNRNIIRSLREEFLAKISNSVDKTTFLSKEFLLHSIKGEFCEVFHNIYISLKNNNKDEIINSTVNLLRLGHTSGIDTLSGIITGLLLVSLIFQNNINEEAKQ